MKRIIRTLLPLLMLSGFYSCTSLLPVNSHFENAATLKKDNVDVSGSYSRYYQEGFGRTEKTNDEYGLRVGIGLSNQFDLKFQYDHLVFSPNFDHSLFRANYIGLIPKIAILPEHLSFMMPVGLY